MLVNNPCINDSRVIREAEALAEAGYEVTVLARRAPGTPHRETRNGVRYVRLIGFNDSWYPRARRLASVAGYLRSDPYRSNWFRRLAGRAIASSARPARRSQQEPALARPGWSWKAVKYALAVLAAPFLVVLAILRAIGRAAMAVERSARNLLASASGPLRGRGLRRLARPFRPLLRIFRRLISVLRSVALRGLWRPCQRVARAILRVVRALKGQLMGAVRKAWGELRRGFDTRVKAPLKRWKIIRKSKLRGWFNSRIKSPVIRWMKRWIAAAFIFEVVDAAMRRTLLRLRPDVIHAHDLMTLPTASRAAEDLGASLVYDSHELEMHRNAVYPKLAWKRRGRLERRHIRRADLTITVSESIADHLRDAYSISRPTVIMNTPLLIPVDAAGESIRQLLRLEPTAPLAIYVGSVTINRGIEVCVRALAHYPELHFATVGPRRKQNEIELLEIAQAEGVSERFHLVDPVAADAVVGFIRDADVSVLPIQNVCLSYYYCMPNKLFESVFSGLPVVVADLVELRRFVERYPCGVVMDETDPRDAARAIRAVAGSRDRYILGSDQLAEVRGKYSWPAQAGMLVEAYRQMTAPPAAAAPTSSP